MANKVYAVKAGKETGLFYSWAECEMQVKGFKGAQYKSFKDETLAKVYLEGDSTMDTNTPTQEAKLSLEEELLLTKELSFQEDVLVIYTDGSNKKDGRYSYGLVEIENNEIVHEEYEAGDNPDAALMRNVAGELMGAMKAVLYAIHKKPKSELIIFHDYDGVAKWVTGEWKAKNPLTQSYKDFMKKAEEKLKLRFISVSGHTGNPFNERADHLAKFALGLTDEQKKQEKELNSEEEFSVKLDNLK